MIESSKRTPYEWAMLGYQDDHENKEASERD